MRIWNYSNRRDSPIQILNVKIDNRWTWVGCAVNSAVEAWEEALDGDFE